jgi:hypothetical protein
MNTAPSGSSMSSADITKSLAYLLLYFSCAVALGTAIVIGVPESESAYSESTWFYVITGFIVALVLSALVCLVVVVIASPLIYTLGRRLAAKLSWPGRMAAYFGFAIVAATVAILGGLPLSPVLDGQPAEWNPHAFFAIQSDPYFAGAVILMAGLSAAGACATIRRSSTRIDRQA